MPFFKSSLNVFDVIELEIGVDPRTVSDFLIEISEQEFCEIKSRPTPLVADVAKARPETVATKQNILAALEFIKESQRG